MCCGQLRLTRISRSVLIHCPYSKARAFSIHKDLLVFLCTQDKLCIFNDEKLDINEGCFCFKYSTVMMNDNIEKS